MLTSLPRADLVLWAVTTILTLLLFFLILLRSQYRYFRFFTVYLAMNLLQTLLQVVVYQRYGFDSDVTYAVVWSSQAIVILARTLAAAEFCYRVLAGYTGVWALGWRILLSCSVAVLLLAIYFGKDGFQYGVMTLEIGSEAFVATLAVGAFLFVRYYQVPAEKSVLFLGLGLGCNSCFKILNDLVVSKYFAAYGHLWNEASMVVFAGVLCLWIIAIRAASAVPAAALELRTAQAYRTLIPGINERLWQLNDQLIQICKLEQPKL